MAFDYSLYKTPYSSQTEMLADYSALLDQHIYYLYKYHAWLCPDGGLQKVMGVVVSREEFESSLMNASDLVTYAGLTDGECAELEKTRAYFISRLSLSEGMPAAVAADRLGLDAFELMAALCLVCCELNRKYEKLFVYLQDDVTARTPTVETLIRLFAEPKSAVSDYFGYFAEDGVLMRFVCTAGEGALCSRRLRLSAQVFGFITGTASAGEDFDPAQGLHPMYINAHIAENIARALALGADSTALVLLSGKTGSGRRFAAKHAAASQGRGLVFLSARELLGQETFAERFNAALCRCMLYRRYLCLTELEELLKEDCSQQLDALTKLINQSVGFFGGCVFAVSQEKWYEAALGRGMVKLDFEIPETNEGERLILWERFMAQGSFSRDIDRREMAAKFRFTAGQVCGAVRRSVDVSRMAGESEVSVRTLHDSCYAQVVVGLDSLASPIKPAYGWEDLVLPESEVRLLKEACAHVKYRHTVYTEWDFGRRAAYGRGLSVLFSGPPGTGKTMAAQVVTNQLNMQMYKIQLSQIVSKYIGETEKNLRRVFTEAKNANCILFFDEMDALFGKRSEVKDSHDRNANVETAYLLQQMEEYDGVVLMATNLLQNIDEAFMRRINFVVSFPFPDEGTRLLLWRKMLETSAPVSADVDLKFLADNFKLAGGNIKNCAVHAAFLAAAEGTEITMRHLVRSVVAEQRKNNVVVLREELKEYADMVFGER